MLHTWLRRGEALALTADDIDIPAKFISVNKSLDVNNNAREAKAPKTKEGYRDIPIPDVLVNELSAYIDTLDGNILFLMRDGSYKTRSSFTKFWYGIIKAVKQAADNEDDITFTAHLCRHTYTTDLYNSEIDVKTSQKWLGHSSVSVTLGIYTHLEKSRVDDQIDKLNEYLKKR